MDAHKITSVLIYTLYNLIQIIWSLGAANLQSADVNQVPLYEITEV